MKKKNQVYYIVRAILCMIVIFAVFIYIKYPKYDIDKAYVKEYVIVSESIQGQVDSSLFGDNPAYEIGVNKEGHIVFKYPDKAFRQMKIDCAKGITAIKKENKLYFFSKWNYESYEDTGLESIETEDSEVLKQIWKLRMYLDIYDNSFAK